jgi:hypothetical protein
MLALAFTQQRLLPMLRIGSAAVALSTCGAHFISGRSLASIRADELSAATLAIFEPRVDEAERSVSAGLGAWRPAKALYREGLGCTLVSRAGEAALRAQAAAIPKRPAEAKPWPRWAANGSADIDASAMLGALDNAFREPDARRERRTRAVLVVYEGRIVAERYAPGFSAATPLIGWSMTKSVLNALVGILVRQGRLDIRQPAPVPEWRSRGDPRGEYGAHWWLNAGASDDPSGRPFPRAPSDLFYASGYEGQAVAVVPSRDLVVVRLGNSQRWEAWSLEDLVADVLAALPR